MTGTLIDWLLRCPTISGVSALTVDCHELGLIDLRRQLAKAVAFDVRARTCGCTLRKQTMSYHESNARLLTTLRVARIRIERGVARLEGRIGPGAAISETGDRAVLHIRTQLPETVLASARGRMLSDFVDAPLLRRHPYPIISAHQDADGLYVWFRVSNALLPMAEVAAVLDRLV